MFKSLLAELTAFWGAISGTIQLRQQIGGPAARHLTDLLLGFFERRYDCHGFANVLPPGAVRKEILANIASQFGELRSDCTLATSSASSRTAPPAWSTTGKRILSATAIGPCPRRSWLRSWRQGGHPASDLAPPAGGGAGRQVAEEHPESAIAWRLVRRRRTPAGLLRTGLAALLASGGGVRN